MTSFNDAQPSGHSRQRIMMLDLTCHEGLCARLSGYFEKVSSCSSAHSNALYEAVRALCIHSRPTADTPFNLRTNRSGRLNFF